MGFVSRNRRQCYGWEAIISLQGKHFYGDLRWRDATRSSVCGGRGRVRWSVLSDGQLSILEIT